MKKSVKEGLSWAAWMFVFMAIIYPLVKGEKITFISILIAIPFWLLGGFFIAMTTRYFSNLKKKN